MTKRDFFDKINYEGGIADAFIGYGLNANDLPVKLRNKFEKLIIDFSSAYENLEAALKEEGFEYA